jgi:CheY-like chemotaxis protein
MRAGPCKTVMVVNDDRAFIDVVGDALRVEGLAVLLVPGVHDAIRALRTGFRPDAVLVDLFRGAAEVHVLVGELQATPPLASTPVIMRSRRAERLAQIAPRSRKQLLALPRDGRAMAELLDSVCDAPSEDASDSPFVVH